MNQFEELFGLCYSKFNSDNYSEAHKARMDLELQEVKKQSEAEYLLKLYKDKYKAPNNEHNLFLFVLLGICSSFNMEKPPSYTEPQFPDIDVDYLPEIQQYLKEDFVPKVYGTEYVCNIANYFTFGIKLSLADMARVFGIDRYEVLAVTKKLPMKDEEGDILDWESAIKLCPELKEYLQSNPELAEAARKLTYANIDWEKYGFGNQPPHRNKGIGQHASGLVISSIPLEGTLPLVKGKGGLPASAWPEGLASTDLSSVGFVKLDFLALEANNKIAQCNRLIMERHGLDSICAFKGMPNWSDTSYLDDPKAISMAHKGDLKGIFQFDSDGIRQLVKYGGVTCWNDFAAYSALYRPGPMDVGMHTVYCNRKLGKEPYEIHDLMKPISSHTYGVLCIQEDTLISLASGQEVPIKEVKKGDLVNSINLKNKKNEIKECHGCAMTRICDGVKITLENGYSVTLTEDHPVLTWGGMKKCSDLNKNDIIACSYKLGKTCREDLSIASWLGDDLHVSYLLGLLTGDAQIKTSVDLATGGRDSHEKIVNWLSDKFPNLKLNEYFHYRSWHVGISCNQLLNDPLHGNRKTRLHKMFEDLDMKHIDKYKRIPDRIMTHKNSQIRMAFLAGLFDSDGCSHILNNGNQMCNFTSCSEVLIQQVRKILQLEGITHKLYENRVYVWDTISFNEKISKYLVIKKISGKLNNGKRCGVVPKSVVLDNIRDSKLSINEYCKRNSISKSIFRSKASAFCRSTTAQKAGIDLGDLRYYKIKKIDKIEKCKFYGMSVADNHNLIANGIVVSNCYQEQVMMILNKIGLIPMQYAQDVIKAISKKKAEKFQKFKEQFIENAQITLSISKEDSSRLWDQVESFAGYGFNLAHTCCYTYISSRQLYQKANYMLEFAVTALRSLGTGDDRIREYILDARRHDVKVNPLSLNKSNFDFDIVDGEIYFGFSKIKGIGEKVANKIIAMRKEPYTGLLDFLKKFGTEEKVVQPLIALKCFGDDTVTLYKYYEYYKDFTKKRKDRRKRHLETIAKNKYKMAKLVGEEVELNDFTILPLMNKVDDKISKAIKKLYTTHQKSVAMNKTKDEAEKFVTLEEFDPSSIKIKKDIQPILMDQAKAEEASYGFVWKHPIENAADLCEDTFDKMEAAGQVPEYPVEVLIKKVFSKTSQNGRTFYSVYAEDVNCKLRYITVWKEDYDRFKDELKAGYVVRMRVKPPQPPYKGPTFASFSWKQRLKLPEKKDDIRLRLLWKPEG